jgi:mRNA interferase MazF
MKFNFGQVVLAEVQYTDTFEVKTRLALILFEEQGNIVVAGITSNLKVKGILLNKKKEC